MKSLSDNHPAFPCSVGDQPRGLTKRELFAAMAMQGLLAFPGTFPSSRDEHHPTPDELADRSILYADAVLRKLKDGK